MAVLHLTQQGATLHRSHERLVVRFQGEVLQEIPLSEVEQVVLWGRGVQATTAALHILAQQGVPVFYFTQHGRFVAHLLGEEHSHVHIRFAQTIHAAHPEKAFVLARTLVLAKLQNQYAFLRRRIPGKGLHALWEELRAAATVASSLEALRGIEGRAAALYFRLWPQLLKAPEWTFSGRAYYPPPDPTNALLSLAYTLLLKDALAACRLAGLDPDIGFLHALTYGRPSMALDLMEPFRPLVADAVVLHAINGRRIRLQDFGDASGNQGIRLKHEALQRFLRLYETRMQTRFRPPHLAQRVTYRRALVLQARHLARVFLGREKRFHPITLP